MQSGVTEAASRGWQVLRRLPYRTIALLLALGLVALTWWGYSASPPYTPRASSEWSKGLPVGQTSQNEIVAAQATTHSTYLVWVDPSRQLHYARLNRSAQVAVDTFIAVPTFYPRNPQLVVGRGNVLHLTWVDEVEGQSVLKYVRLDINGRPQIDPVPVSLPEDEVELARLAVNPQDQVEIFWSGTPGIFHATLDEMGALVRPITLLVTGGAAPNIQFDTQGRVHLAWIEARTSFNQSIHYAVFDPERRVLGRPLQMASVFLRTGQSLDGLDLALDNEYGYIFWSITDRRDGASWTEHVVFPLDDPTNADQRLLRLTGVEFLQNAFALDGQRSMAFVAMNGQVWDVGQSSQIVMALFRDGHFAGHQVITASREASLKPVLLTDVLGKLHLVWLDTIGFNQYRVLYASTTEEAIRALNVITFWDVANTVVGNAMSLTLMIAFLPLMFAWGLLPTMWVLVYFFVTHDDDLRSLQARGALAGAVVLQIGAMMTVAPGVQGAFNRFVLPILLAAVALIGVYIYARVKRGQSLLVAFFIFALTHGLLRLAIYTLGSLR